MRGPRHVLADAVPIPFRLAGPGFNNRAAVRIETQQVWERSRLAIVPGPWRERVRRLHQKRQAAGFSAANLWLLDITDRMKKLRVPLDMDEGDIRAMAAQKAKEAMGLCESAQGIYLSEPGALRAKMAAFVESYGITPPPDTVTDTGAISRMTAPLWWRRKLRVAQGRALEREAITLGYVSRDKEIYASNATVERRTQQRKRNAAMMEDTEATNMDTGEVFKLAELAALSVANPRIRRGELMVRIAGFEAIAQGLGHAAEFITLTAPSKYHPKAIGANKAAFDNPKYKGATPRETQGYLNRIWQRIRAKLGRLGIRPYGFRVAEPHHDGTPHWHILLFATNASMPKLREVIREYALKEDGNESGAEENRVDFEAIDPAKGSAAGYIAVYVSKNIDGGGYEVQGDLEGHDKIVPTSRVEAWASTWGIRQFQQIGGPPVGVWRELRRTEEAETHSETLAAARSAADAGNWRRYVEVMGGPVIERKHLPLRVAYTRRGERYDFKNECSYPAPKNQYGEEALPAVYGVREVLRDRAHPSRRFRWEIKRGKCEAGGLGFRGSRTRVNNCTEGSENEQRGINGQGFKTELRASGRIDETCSNHGADWNSGIIAVNVGIAEGHGARNRISEVGR